MFKKILISFLALIFILIPLNSYSESGKSIVLKINSKIAFVNNQPVALDVAPMIINDRTLMPLRFITENFGAKTINYKPDTQEIFIELEDLVSLREDYSKLIEKNKTLEHDITTLRYEIESLLKKIQELENPPPIQSPNPPTALEGYYYQKQVFLSWDESKQGTYRISGYKILRVEQGNSDFIIIGTVPESSISFIDNQVFEGKNYIYSVRAFDSDCPFNESLESNRILITIPITKPSLPPEMDWHLQYSFPELDHPYSIKNVYMKEDKDNFYFLFNSYRIMSDLANFSFSLWVDIDQNWKTGMKSSHDDPYGEDLFVFFYFIGSNETRGQVMIWNKNTGDFDKAQMLQPNQLILDSKSLTIAIPKKYFIPNHAFDYNISINIKNKEGFERGYPGHHEKKLTYPKPK